MGHGGRGGSEEGREGGRERSRQGGKEGEMEGSRQGGRETSEQAGLRGEVVTSWITSLLSRLTRLHIWRPPRPMTLRGDLDPRMYYLLREGVEGMNAL